MKSNNNDKIFRVFYDVGLFLIYGNIKNKTINNIKKLKKLLIITLSPYQGHLNLVKRC